MSGCRRTFRRQHRPGPDPGPSLSLFTQKSAGLPALSESSNPDGCHHICRSSGSIVCTACPTHTGRDPCDPASLGVPRRPRTIRWPVFTRVSDGNDLRRLDVTSKGGVIFGFDTFCHDNLHQYMFGKANLARRHRKCDIFLCRRSNASRNTAPPHVRPAQRTASAGSERPRYVPARPALQRYAKTAAAAKPPATRRPDQS